MDDAGQGLRGGLPSQGAARRGARIGGVSRPLFGLRLGDGLLSLFVVPLLALLTALAGLLAVASPVLAVLRTFGVPGIVMRDTGAGRCRPCGASLRPWRSARPAPSWHGRGTRCCAATCGWCWRATASSCRCAAFPGREQLGRLRHTGEAWTSSPLSEGIRRTASPLDGSEDGTDDMTNLLLVQIVDEMRRVPDHHVLVEDALSVDEAPDVGWSIRL
jgi:hypothetical protein